MFLLPPVFSFLPPGLLLNLKRRGRERHERIRESRVEGRPGKKKERDSKQGRMKKHKPR